MSEGGSERKIDERDDPNPFWSVLNELFSLI
jgi:hypothetical protein